MSSTSSRRALLGGGLALPIILSSTPGRAQGSRPRVIFASGAPGGTYHTMVNNLAAVLADRFDIQHWSSTVSGSEANMGAVRDGDALVGFVQADTLDLTKRREPIGTPPTDSVNALVTLMALHQESIHVLARAPLPTGGSAGDRVRNYWNQPPTLTTITDLRGRKVGVWGGAAATAAILNHYADIGMQVQVFSAREPAFEALRKGEVHAIIAVGGQPLGWVRDLRLEEFKLLEVPQPVANRLQVVYRSDSLRYANLGVGSGMRTVAVDALLVVRRPGSPARSQLLVGLRDAIVNSLETIRETTGSHAAWRQVTPGREAPSWPMFSPLS